MHPNWALSLLLLAEGNLVFDAQNPRSPRATQPRGSTPPSLGEVESRRANPMPRAFGPTGGRPATLGVQPTTRRILIPPSHPRCLILPSDPFWRRRDLMVELQVMARRGFIPVAKTDPEAKEIQDYTWQPAGWRAYSFLVAPKGKLHIRLRHPNEGWFRLAMFNKWGQLEEGMLGNRIPTGNPEVSYTNPRDEFRFVYVLVDDPGWMSSKENPYRLEIERSWDPKAEKPGDLEPVDGIWAHLEREKIEAGGSD